MNRSVGWIGVGIVVAGFALAGFPILMTGQEHVDPEQLAGCLVAPVGLVVVLLGATSVDPRSTTVSGTFGNTDDPGPAERLPEPATDRGRRWRSQDPVNCRYCRTVITSDLASCPRCARARSCRSCRRPLGFVLDRPTCPTCAQPEAICGCEHLADTGPTAFGPFDGRGPRR